MLTHPFSTLELREAVRELQRGKASGPDGIPIEFFKELWDFVAPDVLNLINYILERQDLGPELSTSIIALIPKSGQHNLLTNWRPIALLNSLYKILTKATANRHKSGISKWVSTSQSTYIPGIDIINNLFFAQEALSWTKETCQEMTILLLDFSKAFDLLRWSFLEDVLHAKGFSLRWISWMCTIYG
jgi:hypothetical protein